MNKQKLHLEVRRQAEKVSGLRFCSGCAVYQPIVGGKYIYPPKPPRQGTGKRWLCAACKTARLKARRAS